MASLLHDWKSAVLTQATLGVWVVVSTVATLTGPFGTYYVFPLHLRAVIWPALAGIGILLGSFSRVVVEGPLGLGGRWRGTLLTSILNVILLTPALSYATRWCVGSQMHVPPTLGEFASFVFLTCFGIGALRRLMQEATAPMAAGGPATPARGLDAGAGAADPAAPGLAGSAARQAEAAGPGAPAFSGQAAAPPGAGSPVPGLPAPEAPLEAAGGAHPDAAPDLASGTPPEAVAPPQPGAPEAPLPAAAAEGAAFAPDPPAAAEPAAPAQPALIRRLPEAQRGALLRLSVRGHYTDVHTENGTVSLLLRFSDAMAEVGDTPGLQVHRSHWVARAAVQGSRRHNGRIFLLTLDGAELPVSRNHLAAAAEAGLLGPAASETPADAARSGPPARREP